MERIDPETRETLIKAMCIDVRKTTITEPVEFTDVIAPSYKAKFAGKKGDLIFHFFGLGNRLPPKLGPAVAKSFTEILGEAGMERVKIEELKENHDIGVIEGGDSICVRARGFDTFVARNALVPRVFELIQEGLG